MITDEMIDYFIKNNVNICTSIDGNKKIIDEAIIKQRRNLADSGVVAITFNIRDNHLLDKPHFNSRGFIYMKQSYELINEIETKALRCANAYLLKHSRFGEKKFKKQMEEEIAAFIYEKVELKPLVVAIVINIEN